MPCLRPGDHGAPYDEYFRALNEELKKNGPIRPCVIIDLDRMDRNLDLVTETLRRGGKHYRIVEKSLHTPARLQQYLELAEGLDTRLLANIEIDVGLYRGGVDGNATLGQMLADKAANPRRLEFADGGKSMSDVTPWLQGLGLEKYDELLASHDIDLAVAPDLTEQDLEKLGLSLGHRRKFIAAAAKLRADPAVLAVATKQVRSGGQPEALVERRQMTVVFIDLVGSTALTGTKNVACLQHCLGDHRVLPRIAGHWRECRLTLALVKQLYPGLTLD